MNIVTVNDKQALLELFVTQDVLSDDDILITGFGVLPDFNYVSEFAGKTQKLKEYVEFSKRNNVTLIGAVTSHLLGKHYNTAIVVHKGIILGVSDQTHKTVSDELALGTHLKLYQTDIGIIGLLIGEDIFFPECALSLSLGGADRIVYVTSDDYKKITDTMLKAASIFCGVNITALFSDFTVEYTPRGTRSVIEPARVVWFQNVPKKDNKYMINRREEIFHTVVLNKKANE